VPYIAVQENTLNSATSSATNTTEHGERDCSLTHSLSLIRSDSTS
jgi:hypothetical protein